MARKTKPSCTQIPYLERDFPKRGSGAGLKAPLPAPDLQAEASNTRYEGPKPCEPRHATPAMQPSRVGRHQLYILFIALLLYDDVSWQTLCNLSSLRIHLRERRMGMNGERQIIDGCTEFNREHGLAD